MLQAPIGGTTAPSCSWRIDLTSLTTRSVSQERKVASDAELPFHKLLWSRQIVSLLLVNRMTQAQNIPYLVEDHIFNRTLSILIMTRAYSEIATRYYLGRCILQG